jgi:glycosyltransferase involved in cell wall biosynthesis
VSGARGGGSAAPSVSIGLPTFNRANLLDRAIRSALEQTWTDLELVISDNASTDATEDLCRSWAARDDRVIYRRRERNLGPTANFNGLFEECSRREFAMLLSDDDWLDRDYVARCRAELVARPDHALVAGTPYYERAGRVVYEGLALQLQDEDPADRVVRYYTAVVDNGTFYGLMRGAALAAAAPMANVVANDWHLTARVVSLGKVLTLTDTHVHMELGGTSASIADNLRVIGGDPFEARMPHLFNAARVFTDVVAGSDVFREIPLTRRVVVGVRSGLGVIDWPSLAWHVTEPTARRLGRRPRGRWVWRFYDRLTRMLGAGRTP